MTTNVLCNVKYLENPPQSPAPIHGRGAFFVPSPTENAKISAKKL